MANLYDQEPETLAGINAVAEREIFPRLREMGDKPAREMKKQKYKYFGVAVLVSLGIGLFIGGFEGFFLMSGLTLPFMLIIAYLLYRLNRGKTGELGAELQDVITKPIVRHAGLALMDDGAEEFARKCMAAGVTGNDFDSFHVGSYLTGKLNNLDVACCLLSMGEHENRSREFTMNSFSGTLYAIETGEAMIGRTILMPQLYVANFANDWALGKEFEKVDTGTAEFQKWFVVYSTDAANAKVLLNETMQDRMVRAVDGVAKTGAAIALEGGTIYLSVVDIGKDRLLPKMKPKAPVDDPAPVRDVVDAVAEIVKRLKDLSPSP